LLGLGFFERHFGVGVSMSTDPLAASRSSSGQTNVAQRRYLRRFLTAVATYVVVLLTVITVFRVAPPDGILKYALATLPALPLVAIAAVFGAYLRDERDEFLRLRQALALLVAVAVTLPAASVWGFLEAFAAAPHINMLFIVPVFCVIYAMATAFLERVYR
jgi:hypothetical protein